MVQPRNTVAATLPDFGKAYDTPLLPCEYMIVLSPHEDLQQRILKVKQSFAEKFQVNGHSGKPHICLARFRQYDMKEHYLINKLKLLAMSLPAFRIELDGFGCFPTHTIYLKVKTMEPVKAISRKLREARNLMTINKDNKPHFLQEPHISIARKLQHWQYEQGWAAYEHQHFHASFIADHIVFLKRRADATAWQVVDRFGMMNLPVETRQGDLFG